MYSLFAEAWLFAIDMKFQSFCSLFFHCGMLLSVAQQYSESETFPQVYCLRATGVTLMCRVVTMCGGARYYHEQFVLAILIPDSNQFIDFLFYTFLSADPVTLDRRRQAKAKTASNQGSCSHKVRPPRILNCTINPNRNSSRIHHESCILCRRSERFRVK